MEEIREVPRFVKRTENFETAQLVHQKNTTIIKNIISRQILSDLSKDYYILKK